MKDLLAYIGTFMFLLWLGVPSLVLVFIVVITFIMAHFNYSV